MLYLPRTQKPELGVPLRTGHWSTHRMVAHYAFNEAGGGTAYDLKGNSNGAWNGTDDHWAAGSAIFQTSDYLDLPANIVDSNILSISFRAKFNVINVYQAIISIYTNNGDSIEIFVSNANARLFGGNFSNQALTAISSINTTDWFHVVLVSDGTNTVFYLNGKLNGTAGTTNFSTFNDPGTIGSRSSSFPLTGFVDQLSVYNRVLLPSEASELYANPNIVYQPQLIPFAAAAAPPAGVVGDIYYKTLLQGVG